MLYINNPDARTAIIEQTRRDHGQHTVTVDPTEVSPAAAGPSRTRRTLGFLVRPATAG